jgi:hypothetical protein
MSTFSRFFVAVGVLALISAPALAGDGKDRQQNLREGLSGYAAPVHEGRASAEQVGTVDWEQPTNFQIVDQAAERR